MLTQLNFNERSELIRLLSWATRGRLGTQRPAKVGSGLYFASLADIVSILAKAGRERQLRERIRLRCRLSLLIVDEVEYLSVIRSFRAAATCSSSSSTCATGAGP